MSMQDPEQAALQPNPAPAENVSSEEMNVPTAEETVTIDGEKDIDPEQAAEMLETEAEETADDEQAINEKTKLATLDDVLAYAKEVLARDAALISREDVSRLRGAYIAVTKPAETTQEEDGEESQPTQQPEDDEFSAILAEIRKKKAEYIAAKEAEKANNLEEKNKIIAEINALADDTDNIHNSYERYRELQTLFNATGDVPPQNEKSVWEQYQDARTKYADNLKINKELRDYDFSCNLVKKEELIAKAAQLVTEKDVVQAFRRMQSLHNEWRQVGPVAKEKREDVWKRFKEATQEINRKHQAYFEERKARENENEAAKTAICERVEALDLSALKTFAAWDKMTDEIKQAQADWRKLGYASRKVNNALFNRFRATCDTFFTLKAAYFKEEKERSAANLAAKEALVKEAEELKESTDWRKTGDRLVELQKQWKTIGSVPKKYSDSLWKRFQEACDTFFANKKAATSGQRQTEHANLQAKRDLIAELDKITDATPRDEARALISDLQERWKLIGHVPFREKERVYEQFRQRINDVREKFNITARRENMNNFRESVAEMSDDATKMARERERQVRLLETRRAELRTYENNLGFLNAKSKSGNSLVRDFQRKIEHLKADIASLEEKIKVIDTNM